MNKTSRKRKIVTVASVIFMFALGTIYFVLSAPKRRIDRFLREVSRIEMGKTTIGEWRHWSEETHQSAALSCEGENCAAWQHAEIKVLSTLHLAPPSGIIATVKFKNGIASEAQVMMEIDDREINGVKEPGTGATIDWAIQHQTCTEHFCTYMKERWGYPWGVIVMDSEVSQVDRSKALAINTDCLIRIGGCRTLEAILPRVFGKSSL